MKSTLKRLTICPCGFGSLADSIPLGTEYEINPDQVMFVDYLCGGCKRVARIPVVYADREGNKGYVPMALFEPSN